MLQRQIWWHVALRNRSPRRFSHSFPEHPMRRELVALQHQRPFDRIPLPSLVTTITLTHKNAEEIDGVRYPLSDVKSEPEPGPGVHSGPHVSYQDDYAHLKRLCEYFLVAPPHFGAAFFSADLAGSSWMRWERLWLVSLSETHVRVVYHLGLQAHGGADVHFSSSGHCCGHGHAL